MDVFEAVKTRRSIRKFKDKIVEQEKLEKVLEAARLAPSAANRQPWSFIAISDKTIRQSLFSAYNQDWFVNAPIIIVACGFPDKGWRRQDGEKYYPIDVAIAMQNMILVAHSMGLGTCWIAAFDEKKAKKALDIPKKVRIIAMTPLGYPDEVKGPITKRKTLEEIIHYDKWQQ